jgi:hypothetical protein
MTEDTVELDAQHDFYFVLTIGDSIYRPDTSELKDTKLKVWARINKN